jgi:hypothetical protein
MGGAYPGPNNFQLLFYEKTVLVGCRELLLDGHDYTVELRNGQALVTVAMTPRPLLFTVQPDGRLAGPGPIQVTGPVVIGTQEGTRTYSDGRTEPISRPVYGTRTVSCTAGLLAASGPAPLEPSPGKVVANLLGRMAQDLPAPTPPGLRISGLYGSMAALNLEFHPESVILGCGEAILARPYTVQASAGQAVIRIEHATPLTLSYRADGSIAGPGTVDVSGRVLMGKDANEQLVYAARSGRCPLGNLTPAP